MKFKKGLVLADYSFLTPTNRHRNHYFYIQNATRVILLMIAVRTQVDVIVHTKRHTYCMRKGRVKNGRTKTWMTLQIWNLCLLRVTFVFFAYLRNQSLVRFFYFQNSQRNPIDTSWNNHTICSDFRKKSTWILPVSRSLYESVLNLDRKLKKVLSIVLIPSKRY